MAKRHLTQYDSSGNRQEIYLNDDEVMCDDKTLAAKLEEMQEDIDEAASQGGIQQETDPTVPSWAKQPTKPTYTAQDVGAMPAGTFIPSKTSDLDNDSGFITLADVPEGTVVSPATATPQMDGTGAVGTSLKYAREDHVHPHDTTKQDTIVAGNGIVIAQDGKTVSVAEAIRTGAGKGATAVQSVSVESEEDGTVDIHVDDDTFSINLNHTHKNMAKLVITDEEPSNPALDTIYAQVDDADTPTEIVSLWIAGLEFIGGGGSPNAPRLIRPTGSTPIDMGQTVSGTVSKNINVKAKNLTQSLIVEFGSGSTGYSFDTTNLPTGVTYDSGTGKLTITKEAATAINGVYIPIVYTGSDTDENAEGTIGISSSSVDGINVEVTLVANKVTYEDLAGVKLTGSQWMQTDYKPNANTEFRLTCRFEQRSDTQSMSKDNYEGNIFSVTAGQSNKWFYLRNPAVAFEDYLYNPWDFMFVNEDSVNYGNDTQIIMIGNDQNTRQYIYVDPVQIYYTKGASNGTIGFTDGTHTLTKPTSLKSSTQENMMMIGRTYNASNGKDMIYSMWDLTIYSLIITENGTEVRHWVAKSRNGVPGLYDTVNNTFMSSETSTELVPVTNS